MMLTTLLGTSGSGSLAERAAFFGFFFCLPAMMSFRRSCTGSASRAGSQGACRRSEEHTSELQSLMRISYAVFCLKKKKITILNIKYYSSRDSDDQHKANIHDNNT